MNKTKNILKSSGRFTKKKYGGAIAGLNTIRNRERTEPTPDIGIYGNILRKLPYTKGLVHNVKIKKINDALRKNTPESINYAIKLLNTKINLDEVNGGDHPLFVFIEYVIGRIKDHDSRILFNKIRSRMTKYDKIYKGQSFLTFLFENLVAKALSPIYKAEYVDTPEEILYFIDLVNDIEDLERKDIKAGRETFNILDYVLHPGIPMDIVRRKKLLDVLMKKNIQFECADINAIFALSSHIYYERYPAFDMMEELIKKGININVYDSEHGIILENFKQNFVSETTNDEKVQYYNNISITKFIPSSNIKNDVDLSKLNVDKVKSPALYLIRKIESINNIISKTKDETNNNNMIKEGCIKLLELMIPALSKWHLLYIVKYIDLKGLHFILNFKELRTPLQDKINCLKTYPDNEIFLQIKTIVLDYYREQDKKKKEEEEKKKKEEEEKKKKEEEEKKKKNAAPNVGNVAAAAATGKPIEQMKIEEIEREISELKAKNPKSKEDNIRLNQLHTQKKKLNNAKP